VRPRLEGVAWACLVVLGCAATYESLIALEVIPLGSEPGRGARGSSAVLVAALIALLCGAAAACPRALTANGDGHLAVALLAPVGVAFVVTRWLSFGPYYLPALRRYSSGVVSGTWIVVLSLAGTAAVAFAALRPRAGATAVSAVLVVSALTAWALPLGK
jgi:hypothetical protein